MHEPSTDLQHSEPPEPWALRDVATVVGLTLLAVWVSIRYELSEVLYAVTRRWEPLQVDEWPIGLLVLSMSLIWLSWKRFRQASTELQARHVAEARWVEALAENRRLAHEALRLQEAERKHLARELHDEMGQYLNAIKLDAVAIGADAGDSHLVGCAAQSIVRSVDHAHRTVSDMIGRLRPVGLDELGLVSAIEHCVDEWRRRVPDTRFTFSACGDFENLSEPLTLTTYRLVQEGLTNIYKHAQAKRADITLERNRSGHGTPDELRLTVTDDGRGMDPTHRVTRFGLSGMRERTEIFGGNFVLNTSAGHGLTFAARLPIGGVRP